MNKEAKAVALAGLTLLIYALTGLLRDGALIFPFPLNEFVYLVVAFRFLFWHHKKGALPWLFAISSLAAVFGTVFLWEILLSTEQLQYFFGYTVVDWARLTSEVFLIAAGFYFVGAYKKWYFKALFVLGLATYSYGFIVNDLDFRCLGLIALLISVIIKPVRQPFHLLWILLFLLEGSEWLTFVLARL